MMAGLGAVSVASDHVVLLVDGVRRTFSVHIVGDEIYVDTPHGSLALREQPRLTGAGLPDPLAQLGVRKFLNTRTERLVSRPGMPIWEETRGNAMAVGQREQSGARKLMALLRASPLFPRLRVHLISHSAGAIAQIYLAEAMVEAGWKIDSVISMAPAARISDFADHLSPHLQSGGVKRYLQFHLTDDRESTDREFEPLYGRSLLFLVSEAFEGGAARPMLGMQRYFAQSRVVAPPAQIDIYTAPGEQSQSVSHSEFPRDPATLNTVIGYIKQAAPSVSAVAMPPARQRASRPPSGRRRSVARALQKPARQNRPVKRPPGGAALLPASVPPGRRVAAEHRPAAQTPKPRDPRTAAAPTARRDRRAR